MGKYGQPNQLTGKETPLMKSVWLSLSALVCLSAAAMAQMTGAALRYDPSNEVTVRGTVVEIRNLARPGTLHGTYLVLKTPTDTLNVHLGPRRWSARGRASLTAGEPVEVVGCVVSNRGSQILLAREVRKAGSVLTFRSARGLPTAGRAQRP